LEDELEKQTCMKTETCKLYCRGFWIFLPYVIKIDTYNFELYRFKVGAFLRHRHNASTLELLQTTCAWTNSPIYLLTYLLMPVSFTNKNTRDAYLD